jgi:hypothetical protein
MFSRHRAIQRFDGIQRLGRRGLPLCRGQRRVCAQQSVTQQLPDPRRFERRARLGLKVRTSAFAS